MQNAKRAILWGLEDLLGGVVDFFLSSRPGWDVSIITEKEGIDTLIHEVKQQLPNVVIFCTNECEDDSILLLQLLQKCPEVKVVTVNRGNNTVEIFKKQQIWLKEVADLVTAVES